MVLFTVPIVLHHFNFCLVPTLRSPYTWSYSGLYNFLPFRTWYFTLKGWKIGIVSGIKCDLIPSYSVIRNVGMVMRKWSQFFRTWSEWYWSSVVLVVQWSSKSWSSKIWWSILAPSCLDLRFLRKNLPKLHHSLSSDGVPPSPAEKKMAIIITKIH